MCKFVGSVKLECKVVRVERKATMKESPKRYINPFLSDEENEKVNLWNQVEDEKFENSLLPSNVTLESLEKAKDFYVDKNVTECELPELIACYDDNGFHVVKDIGVDDGLSHGEKIECAEENHKLSCNPISVNGEKPDDMNKDDNGTQLISSALVDSYKNTCLFSVTKHDNLPSNGVSDELKLLVESNIVQKSEVFDSNNLMQNDERKLDLDSNSLNNSFKNVADQSLSEAQSAGTETAISNETKMEENTASISDNVKPATNNDPQSVTERPLETKSAPNNNDVSSDNATVANQLQRGGCESSFTITAPVSGLITYSGPVSSAGSISHRSDGSNTSVGSFAFPILPNEWNSSPVRMAKVNSRQSRKIGGWKQAFMCCRF